jgi:hypothetical protein
VFGIGLMIMVAPLTTALMTSVPARNSGVASAINNAISRVGSPLVSAVIFIAVSASFYGTIAAQARGTPVESSEFRQQVAPLNPPDPSVSPEVRSAARDASTDAFHLAMLVAAGLMFAGAAVNGLGIRNPQKEEAPAEERPPGTAERVDTIPEGVPCLPVPQPTGLPEDPRMHAEPDRR